MTIHDSGTVNLKPPGACDHTQDCDCLIEAEAPQQQLAPKWEYKQRQSPKWGTVTKEGLCVGRGLHRRVVPPDEVYKLAALGCSLEEMSDWFQVKPDTLKYNFADYIAKGRADLKHRLRRAQIQTALNGNPTMLVWLGKNILGQTDNPLNNEDNQPLPWTE